MSHNARSLIIRKCMQWVAIFVRVLTNCNDQRELCSLNQRRRREFWVERRRVEIDKKMIQFRIVFSTEKRSQFVNIYDNHAMFLITVNRITANITHSQELKTLVIQVNLFFNFVIQDLMKYQIVDRSTNERCTRCFQIEENKSNLIFLVCRRVKDEFETCDECWFWHKTSKCSLSMFVSLLDSIWIDNWFVM